VLFIDAARLPKAQGDRPEWDAVSKTVVDAWRAFDHGSPDSATVPDVAAAVRVMEVLDEDVDLTPARYVRAPVDLERVPGEVNDSIRDLADEMSGLVRAVESVGSWSAASGKPWRTATIADLAAGGALQLITAAPVQDADHFELSADDAARPVLTARDIVTGGRPSGAVGTDAPPLSAVIFEGDVLMPRIRSDRDGRGAARVASAEDDGAWLGEHVFLFRPDPERLDPWFLAGFAGSAENASAMLGTTMIRLAPQRIRIPLLPLAEQRRYGDAFRRLHDLRIAARCANDSAARVAGLVAGGLTAGALEPHNTNTASSPEPAEPKLRRGRK
jgi:hypothetical protein